MDRFSKTNLNHDLESVEASGLGDLYLAHESLHDVLVHDAIASSEEGQHVLDEILLVRLQKFV